MKYQKVTLWLRVENNNKYVRGRKRARERIEMFILSQYNMKKSFDQATSDDWVGSSKRTKTNDLKQIY